MKRFRLSYLFIVFLSFSATAQDIHFSEFYNTPLLLNPSYTGFFNGDYRFTAIYRDQWSSITVPYSTIEGSADLRILTGSGSYKKNILGLGINVFSDKAGDSQFSTNEVTLSSAFSVATGMDRTNYLSGGLSAGIGDASIDYSNLVFDQQYFEPNTPTAENVALNSYDYLDLSGGVSWHLIPNKFTNFNIGAAVFHINQPNESFFGDGSSILFRKYVVDASAQFSISNNLDLYPKTMFEMQGPYNELDLGGLLRCNLSPGYIKNEGIYFGAFYRYGDAIIVTTRLDMNAISFAFSYDITVSHLVIDGEAQGGPEISIIYIGKFINSQHTVYCPRF
jgi:type IX secretion system PorP/SprF family membrane protein